MVELALDVSMGGKTWCAQIVGKDPDMGLARQFIAAAGSDLSRSGRTGTKTYIVDDGLYETNEGRRRLGRRYWLVHGGEVVEITRRELMQELKRASR